MSHLYILTLGDIVYWAVLAALVAVGLAGVAWAHGHAHGARSERAAAVRRDQADMDRAAAEFGPRSVDGGPVDARNALRRIK